MATDEDYGDYVTRCVCGYTHDDGYMICCDVCSVWQHVECMKVDPKNLPDKYLCEKCDPRPVDKKRARGLQMKKRDDLSDFDDEDGSNLSTDDGRRSPLPSSLQQLQAKRRRKQQQRSGSTRVQELKVEARKTGRKEKIDKEKEEGKKAKRKIKISPHHSSSSGPYSPLLSGVQTLLSAASALEEQQQQDVDLWSSSSSPWNDPYDACHQNVYSENVLSGSYQLLRSWGTVYSTEEFVTVEARVSQPMCMLRDVASYRKGVVAASRFAEQSIIMEYKGRVLQRQELSGGRFLWKHSPCPFVYQYNRLEVCIDARYIGNLARFVRRSCKPNTELRHFFVSDKLHFGIYATSAIAAGEEITLPFDFRYEKCEYLVECACGGSVGQCMLSRSPGIGSRRKSSRTSSTDEDHPPKTIGRSPCVLSTQTLDEDSNSSWTSTGSHRKRTRQLPPRPNREQMSDSDSEEHEDSESKRSKSREERKTEAVWRMFEKMEASERRRHHLLSESSQDGEQSPFRSGKERRVSISSTGSKKSHLLPASRLASSTDLLSPEPMDAFSPPLTPSLTSSLTNIPGDSLPSPSHVAHRLSYEATPYLHPNYLLADFALPRKKAILHQWEAESREGERDLGGGQNIIVNGSPQWAHNGYSVVATARKNNKHTRLRGCLKHRWMDQHKRDEREAKVSDSTDKNNLENGCSGAATNHKKRLLHRWLELQHEDGRQQQRQETEMETDAAKEVAQDEEQERPPSSLFEDFSDDDFDEREENGASKEGVKANSDNSEPEKSEEKKNEVFAVTPPTSPSPTVAVKPPDAQIQQTPLTNNPPTSPLKTSPIVESASHETAPEKTEEKLEESEMDISSPQSSTRIQVVTDTTSPVPVNLSDSLSSVSDDPLSDKLQPEILDSLSRPVGKRKMSLLEYRSRGKRPGAPEVGKKTILPPISIDRTSVSSPSSTSTSSLLSPSVSLLSFSSSFLSGSSRHASQPSTPHLPPSTSAGSPPPQITSEGTTGPSHFEPVSPDDEDLSNQQGTEETPVPQSTLSSQPLPSVSPSSHKPPDSPAAVIRNSTHGYVTPPVPTAGRGGQFIMDSRWPTIPTGDVQDPRRSIHHSVDVYPPPPLPPIPIPGIPMEAQFPQYSPVHPHHPPQQMQRGLLPHPSPGLLQPTTAIPPHPPPPGGYIMFRPPHHPHSTTYH